MTQPPEFLNLGGHLARHTAPSHWIAAGLDVKRISTFLSHSSVAITMDRYGHLLTAPRIRPATCSTSSMGTGWVENGC